MTHESDVLNSDIGLREKLLVKIEEETKQAEEVRIMKFLICTSETTMMAVTNYLQFKAVKLEGISTSWSGTPLAKSHNMDFFS